MGKQLQYISTCNLNHDLVEYPKGAVLTFDESSAVRIELLDKGLIIPARAEDLSGAPDSTKVKPFKSLPGEKAKLKEEENKTVASSPAVPNAENEEPVKRGYCRKCKAERDVLKAKFVKSSNNRMFIKGVCAECKSKINSACKNPAV